MHRHPLRLSWLMKRLWLSCVCFLFALNTAYSQDKPDYPLGAGDTIRIQVFQNPDLTLEVRVSENGQITYPLIGAIELGGLSVAAAEQKIAHALESGGFLKKPQVTITLQLMRGNQVSVLGQVNRPGRYPLETATIRVSDMLATAGGSTANGDDTVIVTGVRHGKAFTRRINIPALFLDGSHSDNLILQGGDSIYVHRAPVFYIYGEAQRPGSFRIERGMTIMQALALGGGPNARGSENRLRLSRRDANGTIVNTTPELNDAVQPDDVIYVKESIF